jgi:pimeloyl-ACP methyl ester carboxylesterase
MQLQSRGWAKGQLGDFLHPEKFPDWPARYRVQLQYKGFRRARFSDVISNADVDQTSELTRVGRDSRPVLVIWGKQDSNVPFENSETLMKLLQHGRLVAVATGDRSVRVWNADSGKEIAVLLNETFKPGSYEVESNASNYPSGIYYYKLMMGEFKQTKKMILLK